jgi:hypothetical protein
MHLDLRFLAVLTLSLRHVIAQANGCPTTDLACHDIINSSQCIEQQVLEGNGTVTKAGMIKCVEYEGTASSLPGAVKVWLYGLDRAGGLLRNLNAVLPMPGMPYRSDKCGYCTIVPTALRVGRM